MPTKHANDSERRNQVWLIRRQPCRQRWGSVVSRSVNIVISDIHAPDDVTLNIKRGPADRRRSRPHELSCHKPAESLWILCGRSRGLNGFCLKILNAAAARCRSCGDNLLKAPERDLAARKRYFTPADRDLVEPHPTRLRRHVQFRPSPA